MAVMGHPVGASRPPSKPMNDEETAELREIVGGFGWQALFFGGAVSGFIWAAAGLLLLGLTSNTFSKMRQQRAARPRYRNSI